MAAKKSAKKAPPEKRTPKHGKGKLLTGGMPGNKGGSGRPPLAFKAYAQELASDPAVRAALKAKACEGDVSALKLIVQYAEGLPVQQLQHSGEIRGGIVLLPTVDG